MIANEWNANNPTIASNMQHTLIKKNNLAGITRKMNAPEKHPKVRKIKYRLVANPASVSDMPTRSISILGAVVFVPTSIPTWHMIPRNDKRMKGLPNSFKQATKPEALSAFSSSIGVADKNKIAKIAITI